MKFPAGMLWTIAFGCGVFWTTGAVAQEEEWEVTLPSIDEVAVPAPCPLCGAEDCTPERARERNAELFEDPLYKKLTAALELWPWEVRNDEFARKMRREHRNVGETCDARWFFRTGCNHSSCYGYQSVAIVDDAVELHDYLNETTSVGAGVTSQTMVAFMRLNQFTRWGHYKVDFRTGVICYVFRLPRSYFETDFDAALKLLLTADKEFRGLDCEVLHLLATGYEASAACEKIFGDRVRLWENKSLPKRSRLLPISYRTDGAILDE